jgi:hypothetical protein
VYKRKEGNKIMARTDLRNTTNRESTERKNVFEEPNWLNIPNQVQERFRNQGLALRWIRVTLKNQDDYQNVGKRLAEGWEFVTSEEVPEMLMSSVVREGGRYAGTICRGDLALAKMPVDLAASRQEFYERRSKEMVDAVNTQLMSSSDSRMPISNTSRSQISRGTNPRFQD